MKIIYYILVCLFTSIVFSAIYKWIKMQFWIHQNRPGNDIPNGTYKQTFSLKKHLQSDDTSGQITTINMFLESYRLLELSLFTREELSEQIINDAYSKKLKEHINDIQKGVETDIDITRLKLARDYLKQTLNLRNKPNNGAIN